MVLQRKYWTYNRLEDSQIKELTSSLHISRPLAKLLLNRGIGDYKEAENFLNPDIGKLYNPFLLKDMDRAVERIRQAIENKEKICIYGDYDVDGISSISIMIKYFDSINYRVNFYIPDRQEEGYGLNKEAIDRIAREGNKLIITVDCGISSIEEVDYGNSLGIDTIITDHHQCQEILPKAYAIINPMQDNCSYPFKLLCGCGVALKIIQALTPEEVFEKTIYDYLDIAAIATVADVVPLVDENRIIVKNGLDHIKNTSNIGIQALLRVSGLLDRKLNTGHIAFGLAPRINAVGRMSIAELGVELLTSKEEKRADQLAQLLDKENKERQDIEEVILEEAINIIEGDPEYKEDKVLVVYNENWHTGVIGIVASRIVERYHKPTIILGIEETIGKGSARSIAGFNIFEAIGRCKDLLIKYGGHDQAAGLSVNIYNLEKFRKEINLIAQEILTDDDLIPRLMFDDILKLDHIDNRLIDEIEKLQPFGTANPSPRFVVRSSPTTDIRRVGSEGKHLKLSLASNNRQIDCIAFGLGDFKDIIDKEDKIDLIFTPEYNSYNGNTSIQLNIRDIKISQSLNYKNHPILKDYYKNFSIDFNRARDTTIDKSSEKKVKIFKNCRDRVIIEKLGKSNQANTSLIMVNTLEGSYRLLSLLDYRTNRSKYTVSVDYNIPRDTGKEYEIKVVINPLVDKIDYKRYNNIIVYDMFYFENQFKNFINKSNMEGTIFLYTDGDERSNFFVLQSIIPNREELVYIYKYLKNSNYNKFVFTLDEIYSNLDQKYNLQINERFLNNCLAIFQEGGLLTYKIENHIYSVDMAQVTGKIDLARLDFVQYLENKKEEYKRFKNTWLDMVSGGKTYEFKK